MGKPWENGGLMGFNGFYPLVMINMANENDHLWWVFPLNTVIFHSYVKLPEGIGDVPGFKPPF